MFENERDFFLFFYFEAYVFDDVKCIDVEYNERAFRLFQKYMYILTFSYFLPSSNSSLCPHFQYIINIQKKEM